MFDKIRSEYTQEIKKFVKKYYFKSFYYLIDLQLFCKKIFISFKLLFFNFFYFF